MRSDVTPPGASFAPSLLRPEWGSGSFSTQLDHALDDTREMSPAVSAATHVKHLDVSLTVPGFGDISVTAGTRNGTVHATVTGGHATASLLMADVHSFLEQNHVPLQHVTVQSFEHRAADIRGAPQPSLDSGRFGDETSERRQRPPQPREAPESGEVVHDSFRGSDPVSLPAPQAVATGGQTVSIHI